MVAQEGCREFRSFMKWAWYALAGVSSPRLAQGAHVEVEVEVEGFVPLVWEVVVVGCVDRGRGVARVNGPGSPPAPSPAAAAVVPEEVEVVIKDITS